MAYQKSRLLREQTERDMGEDNEETLSTAQQTVISDIQAQKDIYNKFDIDYSQGLTYSNNVLALYGINKGRRMLLSDFANNEENPMPLNEIITVLKKVGLSQLISRIPRDYQGGEFQGSRP
ncbi:MAG: hypothetical protein EBR82_51095 [Caulobacteraceae bacterium]|nr:hypothetical protein [Caulobacteraceae bacterium]